MNSWHDRYYIVEKYDAVGKQFKNHAYFLIIDNTTGSNFSFNGIKYKSKGAASAAASHMFRHEQRQIEKLLLGDNQ